MILVGNNLEVLPTLEADSFDSIVTDPPYGLGFMGKEWDHAVPGQPFWEAMLRVAKPGAFLVAFGAPRLYHRMACYIEDAGWELRDTLMWVYGSGFPKSLDVSDAMARRLAGEQLQVGSRAINPDVYRVTAFLREARIKAGWTNARIDALFGTTGMAGHWTTGASQPACPSVRQWGVLKTALGFGDELDALVEQLASTERPEDWGAGGGDRGPFLEALKNNPDPTPAGDWGTALKPAWEPIVLARKPLRGTVAANVIAYGTGALNIGGCRIGGGDERQHPESIKNEDAERNRNCYGAGLQGSLAATTTLGRWPANLVHDGSPEVAKLFLTDGDGSAARFFYSPKAQRSDRNDGCDEFAPKPLNWSSGDANPGSFQGDGTDRTSRNFHPTVKPTELMRWLCRLVTPPAGHVLDPFCGSGSTGRGAIAEGFRFTGIELSPEYAAIAEARTKVVQPGLPF